MTNRKKILLTGAAGFIGFHLVDDLWSRGYEVVAIDNLQPYPNLSLKSGRLQNLGIKPDNLLEYKEVTTDKCTFIKADLNDKSFLDDLFEKKSFDLVIHLAAQTGVRYSLERPDVYIQNNINAFQNILDACVKSGISNLIYASSSSVYGKNSSIPYSEDQVIDSPLSVYAMTKRANELMAFTYSENYGIRTRGLRFFTVYGPWGRSDMAAYIFMESIAKGKEISLFNNGDMIRDFTFVKDVTRSISLISEKLFKGENEPLNITLNIGHSNPISIIDFLEEIEHRMGIKAKINNMPLQPGDVLSTFADVRKLKQYIDFSPETDHKTGIAETVAWYKKYRSL